MTFVKRGRNSGRLSRSESGSPRDDDRSHRYWGFTYQSVGSNFIRDLLGTNFGVSATTLFPDPQGFGEWRLGQERSWNRDVSATGAQELDLIDSLSARQKLVAFRAVWGKGWVTQDQYATEHGLSARQARTDISALIENNVIVRREDVQLIEGPVIQDLRRKLGREA